MFAKLSFSSRITDLGSVALTGPILLCMCRSFILDKYFLIWCVHRREVKPLSLH